MNASDKLPRSGYIQTICDYLLGLIKKLDTKIIDVETLERQKKEAFVTPEMFGAKGDGVTTQIYRKYIKKVTG